ncbi:MAG TPA: glycosyltransferase [Acidimicrobiales bacterium]|nr:glycosyltransferase [Acidimicrobiales bacterium]
MVRAPATVVIPVWNAWDMTRACLDSLAPTLRPRDQVVVVDNGSRDATAAGLRRYPWVEVITNVENRGFAPACNQGAAAARHDVVVFLNNDTVVPPRWLDGLVAPMEDPSVVACGPRSNFVSGPQVLAVPYSDGAVAEMRRFAREWCEEHRGEASEVDRLVGFCLAVRTEAFRAIGGFDEVYEVGGYEDEDLCVRLRAAGGRLMISHESFVHHQGHATFDANGVSWRDQELANRERYLTKFSVDGPSVEEDSGVLVSACLIVKDEEESLPGCLASLAGLADEVVIYDTGSTDSTVALARDAGAVVVEGYWDDDFGRARNSAVAHCTGRWILWIDADEVVEGDVSSLRARLESSTVEGYVVLIENEVGNGWNSRSVHPACRLFRRSVGSWSGTLHEQVQGPGGRLLALEDQEDVRILHHGYTDAAMSRRDKADRNLSLARAGVARLAARGIPKGPAAREMMAVACTNLARTLFVAGAYADSPAPLFEESLEQCGQAAELGTNPATRRFALRMGVEDLLALERLDEARTWADRLRRASQNPVLADILTGRILLAQGDDAGALAFLERVGDRQIDDDGFEYRAELVAPYRARALAALGRHGEAADVLLAALAAGSCDVHVGAILELLHAAGRSAADLVGAVPPELTRPVLAQVLQLAAEPADAVLEAWWELRPTDLAALAAAARVALQLPLVRTLQWSARVREKGLAGACPLLVVAGDAGRPAADRVRAAAVALGTFRDPGARTALAVALAEVPPADLGAARAEVALLCPFLADDELLCA